MGAYFEALIAPLLRRPESASGWKLVGWDDEQGLCVSLQGGDAVLLIEMERRDDSRPCHAHTAHFNVTARRQFEGSKPLTEQHRTVVDAFVRMIGIQEKRVPMPQVAAPSGKKTVVRTVSRQRVLMPEGRGYYYVNPYVGCMVGCTFCYVMDRANLSRRLQGVAEHPWGHWVDVKADAPEILAREVQRHPPGIVRLSPIITDPYMPLERRYRVTRRSLEVLLEAGFRPVVLTRAARVVEDLDLFARFPGQVAIGMSIPTDEDRWRALFEPKADPVEDRFVALESLHAAGVTTFAVIQPMLPMNVEALATRLASCVTAVRIDRMHDLWRVAHLYRQADLEFAMTAPFFSETEAALRAKFGVLGVPVDDDDDLAPLVAGP